jgi:hypothetical protein
MKNEEEINESKVKNEKWLERRRFSVDMMFTQSACLEEGSSSNCTQSSNDEERRIKGKIDKIIK